MNGPAQDLNSDISYRLSAINNTLTPINYLSILSVLPALDDHKIVADENGMYGDRHWENGDLQGDHSAFVTPLTGPATLSVASEDGVVSDASDRFVIRYSVTAQGLI